MRKKRARQVERQEVKGSTLSAITSPQASTQEPLANRLNLKQGSVASSSALLDDYLASSYILVSENSLFGKQGTFIGPNNVRYRHRWSREDVNKCRKSNGSTRSANETQKRLTILLLAILGFSTFVISSSGKLGANATRQAIAERYLISNSDQLAAVSSNRPRLGLLDQTTTSDGILVQTKQGIFKGKFIESSNKYGSANSVKVIGFLGIRYASAPVRRLRFMPPTAFHYPPNQVHGAQEFGPICRQRWPIELVGVEGSTESEALNSSNLELQLRVMRRIMAGDAFVLLKPLIKQLVRREQSEDCLNLNIYLPHQAASTITNGSSRLRATTTTNATRSDSQLLPVLVIIHGESFDFGSGSSIRAADFVRANKGLVVVTFNYRLNILGFPPQLAGASRGNLGLMDQVAALHWIKDNIAAFGGSSGNVTLLGTKRGAIFVNLLMLSPLAKGLFQRAIMEDGSALTPLVANHLISGQNVHSNLPLAHSSQTSNSLQYIRMLAKLVHCPLYPVRSSQTNQQQQQNSTQSGHTNSHQQPQLGFVSSDEAKNNALLFECLRHKPVEQIVQRIPLELLQQNQPTGDISIASRFLKNSASQNEPSFLDSSYSSSSSSQTFQFEQQQQQDNLRQLNSLDFSQLKRLVTHITREQLNRERSAAEVKLDKNNNFDIPQLSELFTAIYGPTTTTVTSLRPLFGPIIDGTIVSSSDDDVSFSMLKVASSFGQRDLMIGISKPVFSSENDRIELRSDYLIADRISERIEHEGVSSEQAIELVNLFVRSFYRHHNQEIANSIINHYLNNANKPVRKRARFNLNSFSGRNKLIDDEDEGETKLRQQQLALLEVLQELFQDSLTNVPVLKTALIHAAKQLDPLLEVFAGQQFEKWKQGRLEGSLRNNIHNNNNNSTSGGISRDRNSSMSTTTKGEVERRMLLESFAHFARQLFSHSDWPLKLHSPASNSQPVQQPKATYLYQLDPSLLIKEVQLALERSKLDYKREGEFDRSTLNSIKDNLDGVLVKLRAGNFERHLSLACAFETIATDGSENENGNEDKDDNDVMSELKRVVCFKLGDLIARFVSTGNLNAQLQKTDVHGEGNEDQLEISLPDQATKYARECSVSQADNHPIQASSESSSSSLSDSILSNQELRLRLKLECKAMLNKLTISYLFNSESQQDLSLATNWTVFNLFSQQIASLLAPKTLWNMKDVSENLGNYDQQKSSLISKGSFWSNFIPALNCTRTQPIIPASLLATNSALPGSLNSSLLSINLAFGCQQGAKTSIDVMDSLIANVEQQLERNIEKWNLMQFSSQLGPTTSQNHHNLRMVNMSRSGTGEESQQDQQQSPEEQVDEQINKQLSSYSNGSLESELIQVSGNSSRKQDDIHVKYVGIVLAACSLVVSITLVSGVFAVVRRRMKWNRNRRKSRQQVSLGDGNHQRMDFETSAGKQHEQQRETALSLEETNGFQTNQLAISTDIDNLPAHNDNYAEKQGELEHEHLLEQFESMDYDIDNQNGRLKNQETDDFAAPSASVYFNQSVNGAGSRNSQTIGLCQSHTSLEVKNEVDDRSRHHMVQIETSPSDQATDLRSDQAEPIMMPILSTPHDRCRSATVERGFDRFNGSNINEHYGGSSSETQNQSTSLTSSSKKRVKISDPIGTARRSKQTMRYNHHDVNDRNNQLQVNTQAPTLYCPVHHNLSSNQTLSIEPNLYVENNLNPTANIHVWNGTHIDLMDHHRLAANQIELNCDQYTTENVPLSYFTTQAFNCDEQAASNHQNMSSMLNNNGYASFNRTSFNQFAKPNR